MLINKGTSEKYLEDLKNGNIKAGLGIGNNLDNFIRFKKSQLNIILGHDNVGKTYFFTYYMLSLALINKIKFCIWSGENSSGQILRDMIQMYNGKPFKSLSLNQIKSSSRFLEMYFDFVDNKKLYKPDELLNIFEQSDCNACLIDPFTGLDRDMSYIGNYEFLNKSRQFCNLTGKTIYISSHPNSESGRSGNLYPESHEWAGHLKAPLKASIEGGKSFLNRCDDMLTIHRLCSHETMKYNTLISIEKIKDKETGGNLTELNMPIICEFNSGLGFKIGGIDNLNNFRKKETQYKL